MIIFGIAILTVLEPSMVWIVTGYSFCSEGTPHSITQINNTGVIEFERQERTDISCSIGFLYNPALLSKIIFEYNTKCFNFVFLDLPIELDFNGNAFNFRSESRRSYRDFDDSGLNTLRIYGENQPPIDSFQLYYWVGKSTFFVNSMSNVSLLSSCWVT